MPNGRQSILAAVVLLWLATAGSSIPVARAQSTFMPFSRDPVVRHGASAAWDGRYTDPGAVFFHDGTYYMFRDGFRNWPASVEWGLVTSPDGYHWTKQGTEPVFTSAQVPYAGLAALASSGLVLDDGTWVIYFFTYGGNPGTWSIGRASAPAPAGPWTADPQPVLKPGSPASWDGARIDNPSVVRTGNGFVMYYGGFSNSGSEAIGMATSPDGVNWTKYNDPSTGDQFAESDPVFNRSDDPGQWDNTAVERPRVQHTPDGWVMLYRAGQFALGYAISADGIHWSRVGGNPVLRASDVPGGTGTYRSNLLYQSGTYFIFWEVTTGNGNSDVSDIYLATHQGALPTEPGVAPTQPPALPSATGVPTSVPTAVPTPQPVATVELPGTGSRTYPDTGKTVSGLFLNYWDGNGGLAQQGFPISEVIGEVSDLDGKPYTVQYFERAVFEYHPENQPPFNVLLSQLGTFQYKKKYPNGAPDQQPNNSEGSVLFPETGKRVGGKFLSYWKSHGGLLQQGYPISDEFQEKSDLNGETYLVQYFERAVFEYHPENQPPYDVLLSQLGTFQYTAKYGGK